MGVLPLQFSDGEDADSLGLDGTEYFDIPTIDADQRELSVTATGEKGTRTFSVTVRIDTPNEFDYFRNGGILHYVLRKLTGTQ